MAIVLDGWSTGDTQYVAAFSTFPDENNEVLGYSIVLLGLSPMEEDENQDAEKTKCF